MIRTVERRRAAVVAFAAVVVLASCGRSEPVSARSDGRPGVIHTLADYLHSFGSIGKLVATSDLIVEGRVVSEVRGASRHDMGSRITNRLVVLHVDAVLHRTGHAPAIRPGDRIHINGEGWWQDESRVVVNGVSWSKPGDEAFYFLTVDRCRSGRAPTLINDQGRYLVRGDDLYGTTSNDRLIERVLDMSADDFRDAVERAAARARDGELKPDPTPREDCPTN